MKNSKSVRDPFAASPTTTARMAKSPIIGGLGCCGELRQRGGLWASGDELCHKGMRSCSGTAVARMFAPCFISASL